MEPSSFSIRDLLAQAAAFLREGDPSGAVARAKLALRVAPDADTRDECALALARLEDAERAWRAAIRARQDAYARREREDARVVEEQAPAPMPNVAPERSTRARRFVVRPQPVGVS